jgi:hypothetical protein
MRSYGEVWAVRLEVMVALRKPVVNGTLPLSLINHRE